MQTAKLALDPRRLPAPEWLAVRAKTRPENDARRDWRNIGIFWFAVMGLHLAMAPFKGAMGSAPADAVEYTFLVAVTIPGPLMIAVSRFVPTDVSVGRDDVVIRFGKKERRIRTLPDWRATKSKFGENWHFTLFLEGGGRLRLAFLPVHTARALAADLTARACSTQAGRGWSSGAPSGVPEDPGATVTPPLGWPEPWAVTRFADGRKLADPPIAQSENLDPPLATMQWQTAPTSRGRRGALSMALSFMALPVAVAVLAALRLPLEPWQPVLAGALGAGLTWAAVRTAMSDRFAPRIGVSRFGFPEEILAERAAKVVERAIFRAGIGLKVVWQDEFATAWREGDAVSLELRQRKLEHRRYLVLRARGGARLGGHQRLKGAIQGEGLSLLQTG